MAIQHVKAIAAKKSNNQQSISAYAFRNSSEVLECARGICTASVSDLTSIASTGRTVKELYEKLDNLRTLIAQARYTLIDIPDQRMTIHELEKLQAALTLKFIQVCRVNQELCEDSAPSAWKASTRELIESLKASLSKQCRRIESFALAAYDGTQAEWCLYLRLCGFTDDLGNTTSERWLCFSTRLPATYSVSVHNCLCLPANFVPHRTYTDLTQASRCVKDLLVGENCETLTENIGVPIKRVHLQKLLGTDLVQSVGVDDTQVVVVLRTKVYRQHLTTVVQTICDKLRSVIPHATVVKRSQTANGNNWVLRIQFTAASNKSVPKTLTVRQAQGLRMLGFDEQSIADFAQCVIRRQS